MSRTAAEDTPTDASRDGSAASVPERRTEAEYDGDHQQATSATETAADGARVLVVTGLSHKNERHYGPLADVADQTTLVCLEPTYDIDDATYVRVPDVGPRIVRVVLLLFVALYEGYRNEYDAVASISLLPYGLYALVLKAIYGYPAHLGIIGIDLDHHAYQWYGPGIRWAFRRFDAVSVPGSVHAKTLAGFGVPAERIEILSNAIDVETYRPADGERERETDYEFVWVGRFSEEKDPVRFVRAVAELDAAGREFRVAMVGDGALRRDVVAEIEAHGLEDCIDLTGWVDDPVDYYHRSEVFVLTSRRDALPLVMLEAMATGLTPVVSAVGSIPDVVIDGENGLLLEDRDPERFASAMAHCLDDEEFRRTAAAEATAVRSGFSMDQASTDWQRILGTLDP